MTLESCCWKHLQYIRSDMRWPVGHGMWFAMGWWSRIDRGHWRLAHEPDHATDFLKVCCFVYSTLCSICSSQTCPVSRYWQGHRTRSDDRTDPGIESPPKYQYSRSQRMSSVMAWFKSLMSPLFTIVDLCPMCCMIYHNTFFFITV